MESTLRKAPQSTNSENGPFKKIVERHKKQNLIVLHKMLFPKKYSCYESPITSNLTLSKNLQKTFETPSISVDSFGYPNNTFIQKRELASPTYESISVLKKLKHKGGCDDDDESLEDTSYRKGHRHHHKKTLPELSSGYVYVLDEAVQVPSVKLIPQNRVINKKG